MQFQLKRQHIQILSFGILLATAFFVKVSSASASSITSVDKTWNKYTTTVLGYSIQYPKVNWVGYAGCTYNTANGDHSYRPKNGYVPVELFVSGNDRYLEGQYYYELTGQTWSLPNSQGTAYFSGCKKRTNSLTLLTQKDNFYEQGWKITVATVNNDAALTTLIQKKYGSACTWSKKTGVQKGVYDVSIVGDGKTPDTHSKCFVNYGVAIKYYPAKHKVAYWNLGQDASFGTKDFKTVYDGIMVKSFRFL